MTKFLNVFFLIFLSMVFVTLANTSCENQSGNEKMKNADYQRGFNLDSIFGEKILNEKTGEIRKDNFNALYRLKKEQLSVKSKIYDINKLSDNLFLVSQKKNYEKARNFNLLLTTNKFNVSKFLVINDFDIVDVKRDSIHWILLLSDFDQHNKYWKSEQQIKVLKLDENLNEIWSLTRNSNYPLSGESLRIFNNKYSLKVQLITGCSICYTVAELVLTKNGEVTSVKSIGHQNSTALSDAQLNLILKN